jgi:hypothetical protein
VPPGCASPSLWRHDTAADLVWLLAELRGRPGASHAGALNAGPRSFFFPARKVE